MATETLPLDHSHTECVCGHEKSEHGQERHFIDTDSRREVCLKCRGYERPGYPNGVCWHRFQEYDND